MASTHYHLRYCMPFIRLVCGDTGLPVLVALISHANTRNRAYPSYQGLMLVTGLARASISKAIHGLQDLSMIEMVSVEERRGDEKKMDSRQNVYELTGYMKIGDLVIPYLNSDFSKLPFKPTRLEEFEFEELVNDVNLYQFTTYTDLVHHVDSKKIYHQIKAPEKKIQTTIVEPLAEVATVAIPLQSSKPLKEKIVPKTTTTKSPLIVNQTNAALGRTPPPNLTDAERATWLKQKPVWSLFAEWHIMNITDGAFDDWRTYKEHAEAMLWDEVIAQAQNMGKWLDAHAKKAKIELTYQWVIEWHRWYVATVMNEKIDKFPTTKDGFRRNFALYVDYLYQQAKGIK